MPSDIYASLKRIASALEQYRNGGRGDILFDSRDHGNYSGYDWSKTVEMCRKADPTGLAVGLLLNEMIETTVSGSKVMLANVLRKPGFVERISGILAIKADLDALIAAPAAELMARISESLAAVSSELGAPSSREVAICLRDAIYCMDSGLTLRWLQCSAAPVAGRIALNPHIRQYPDIISFTDALRTDMPLGAHLARIGTDCTAIGIKQPGRIAYLSSLKIDTHNGVMREERGRAALGAEELSLDTPMLRYPSWITLERAQLHHGSGMVAVGADTHNLSSIDALPRDRLIWLAMVVEMASQKMADAKDVQLAEALARALPSEAPVKAFLPAVLQSNWLADELSLEGAFKSLRFSAWEERFLRPALDGLDVSAFMPLSGGEVGIHLDSHAVVDFTGTKPNSWEEEDRLKNHCMLICGSPTWVGTQQEIEAARRHVLGTNLINYLLKWGNRRFDQLACEQIGWFRDRLELTYSKALTAACVSLSVPDLIVSHKGGVHFYNQSAKHKTYNARCVFNAKSEVTDTLYFAPNSAAEIVEMLGLKDESELPEFLRDWSSNLGWSTNRDMHDHLDAPYGTNKRWDFSREHPSYRYFNASVCINRNNLPAGVYDTLKERKLKGRK